MPSSHNTFLCLWGGQEWKETEDRCENLEVESFWHCFVPTPACNLPNWWGRVVAPKKLN